MEVVEERGAVGSSNAEYEMIQDGATSSSMNEDGQAMDYSALDSQNDEEEVYEVTMEEEYGQGETMEEQFPEGEMVDASSTNVEEEDMMNDDVEEQDYEPEVGIDVAESSTQGIGGEKVAMNAAPEVVEEEEELVQPASTIESQEPMPAKVEEVEGSREAIEASAPKGDSEQVLEQDIVYQRTPVEVESTVVQTELNIGEEEEEAHPDGTDEIVDAFEEGEDIHAPPCVRVTFNGQDFVLFPQSEQSTYMSAQQEEPIAAPRLKADPTLFYESVESLFEALRVKDSLGDFLEDGTELQANFVDLQLVLREDDIYAREVSLNDLHRLHLGLGLTSSLHLTISETPRFITRYNELAAHATAVFGQAAQQTAEAEHADEQEGEVVGEVEQEEAFEDDGTEQGEEKEEKGEDVRPDEKVETEKEPEELYEEGLAEGRDDTEADQYGGETLSLNKAEVESLEASVPHQNYEEEAEAEGEDIVDYDEAYQDDGEKGINGDAEYEAEEKEEIQEELPNYEAEEDGLLRQKRSFEDDDEIETAQSNEGGESKRVKVGTE